jgi:hypothetical protein
MLVGAGAGPATRDRRRRAYRAGAFADTGTRMRVHEQRAPDLAFAAALDLDDKLGGITLLVLASCTGFAAPGVDLALIERLALKPGIERTVVGFMGCHGALNAPRIARHIVRSEREAWVLVACLELCTLHLQETADLEQVLSYLIFADGCAAALVSGEPRGLALSGSTTGLAASAADQITWRIGSRGFDMRLAGSVPATIGAVLPAELPRLLQGCPPEQIVHWAVHPGGRSVLNAVERGLSCRLRRSRPRVRCCAATATCPRQPCCSCSRRCSPQGSADPAARWRSAPGSRSRASASRRSGEVPARAQQSCGADRHAAGRPRRPWEACLKDLEWITARAAPTASRSAGSSGCSRPTARATSCCSTSAPVTATCCGALQLGPLARPWPRADRGQPQSPRCRDRCAGEHARGPGPLPDRRRVRAAGGAAPGRRDQRALRTPSG